MPPAPRAEWRAQGAGVAGLPWRPMRPWMQQLVTDDLDEITATFWQQRDQSRVPHRKGPLGFHGAWAFGPQVGVGHFAMAVGQTLRASSNHTLLHLSPPPGTVYRVGRRELPILEAGTLALLPHGWDATRSVPPGRTLSVGLAPNLLEAELSARAGTPGESRLFGLHTLRIEPVRRAGLQSTLQALVHALRPGAPTQQVEHAQAHLAARICDCLLPGLRLGRPTAVSRRRLADLEAWIDAHLETPLTLGRLCQQAGVGERSLQKAFETHRGMSPMRFVTERRLAAAHRRLAGPAASEAVTHVAMELGFDHLGRFANAYRELFGLTPSEALRQRRRLAVAG